MENMPSWCGQETLPADIGKKLEDGRRIISESLVKLYAYYNPNGDELGSWLEAKKWFENQGCKVVSDEEFNEYRFRVFEVPGDCSTLYFIKFSVNSK